MQTHTCCYQLRYQKNYVHVWALTWMC